MAQTGYTPIQLYYSTTASAVPTNTNLANGELAINITDGKLYYKDNTGTVKLLAGATSGPAGGSNTQVQYNSSGVLAGSSNLTFDGTSLTLGGNPTLSAGTANGVTYLNGSKVLTSGSALTFNGTSLGVGSSSYGDAGTISLSVGVPGTTTGGLQLWASSAQEHFIQWGDSTTGSATYAGAISYSHASDFMRFWINSTEQMRLTSTGLGIGTSSPTSKLTVAGAISVNTGAANLNALNLISGSSGNRIGLSLGRTAQEAYIGIASTSNSIINGDVAGDLDILTTTGNIRFSTNAGASLQATLDSAGNLGLGVTPSAWASTYKAFQMGGGSLISYTGNDRILLGMNTYLDSGGNYTYVGSTYASGYNQVQGQHHWYTAPSGTAGNAITFTQAMTLDASGNWGLGAAASSPAYAADIRLATSNTLRVGSSSNAFGALVQWDNASGVGRVTTAGGYPLDLGTNSGTAFRIGTAGQLGVGGSNYGTAGQVLTSNGSGAAPSWQAGGSGSSQWITSGSDIYYSTGKVTIGGSTPLGTFNLVGLTRPSGVVTYTSAASSTNAQSGLNWYQDNNTNYEYYLDLFATATSESPWGGSNIRMLTTPVGTATAVERVRITRDGYIGMGNLGATGYSNGQLTVGGASGNYATLALSTEPSLGIAGVRAFDGTTGSVMCVAFQAYGGYSANGPRSDGKGNAPPAPGYNMSWSTWPTSYGYWVEAFSVDPLTYFKPGQDNARSLGTSSSRWSVVYAATGSINTSDINVKEQIAPLDDAEKRVATAIKGLIKKFKFKDAVQEKGENARIHVGVIAQEVSAAFVAEGLDPTRYALFCEDTWWQKESFEQLDEVDETAKSLKIEYFKEETEGCTAHTRLGIRYDELFAFLIATL